MSDQPSSQRAAEILAAYGADAARWPNSERSAMLAAVANSAELRAARDEAAIVDDLLRDWAVAPIAIAGYAAATAAATAMRRRPLPIGRWLASGSVAATIAIGLLLARPAEKPAAVRTTTMTADQASLTDEQVFSGLFTLTPDEEETSI